jgi:hypothetical protein
LIHLGVNTVVDFLMTLAESIRIGG